MGWPPRTSDWRFTRRKKPDIICLQEVISFNDQGTGLFITIEMIQKNYNLPFIAFEPVFSFKYMKGTARFGNCILSKFPITETRAIFTHLEHKDDFMWGEDSGNVRNFIHAVIDTGDDKFCHVITHHGYWIPEHKHGNEETEKQIAIIADYIEELRGPIILTGDFNLAPGSKSLQRLNKNLHNLCVESNLETTRTSLTYKTETCDYIFINNDVNVKEFLAEEKIVSDHKALSLNFSL